MNVAKIAAAPMFLITGIRLPISAQVKPKNENTTIAISFHQPSGQNRPVGAASGGASAPGAIALLSTISSCSGDETNVLLRDAHVHVAAAIEVIVDLRGATQHPAVKEHG